jgi:hypothetical protein
MASCSRDPQLSSADLADGIQQSLSDDLEGIRLHLADVIATPMGSDALGHLASALRALEQLDNAAGCLAHALRNDR